MRHLFSVIQILSGKKKKDGQVWGGESLAVMGGYLDLEQGFGQLKTNYMRSEPSSCLTPTFFAVAKNGSAKNGIVFCD